jgi:hypothetical protein
MKIASLAMAAGLSAVFAVSSVIPAQALQIAPPQIERQASPDIVQVKTKWKHRRGHWRGHRHWRGHKNWRAHRHHRHGYYHGRHWRWGGPSVVIGVGPRYRVGNRHVRWCRAQYVSYRKSDNSWKPHHGPRRACVSPYR